jgi:hypothetical protein
MAAMKKGKNITNRAAEKHGIYDTIAQIERDMTDEMMTKRSDRLLPCSSDRFGD